MKGQKVKLNVTCSFPERVYEYTVTEGPKTLFLTGHLKDEGGNELVALNFHIPRSVKFAALSGDELDFFLIERKQKWSWKPFGFRLRNTGRAWLEINPIDKKRGLSREIKVSLDFS